MRLIDADALPRHKQLEAFGNGQYEDVEVVYGNDIDNAPTIDAVEVVRCKDCIYYQDNNDGYPHDGCRWRSDETPDADDFCSFGERKDNER